MAPSPNIVFLILDGLRKDRVATYGHDRETTPAITDLESFSTVYENAYTPAPWTLPTHTSLFSGLYPTEHGITNAFPGDQLQLSGSVPTLTEKLSNNGYRTAGMSNNPWVGQLSTLNRGFDEYVEWDLQYSATETDHSYPRKDRLMSQSHKAISLLAKQPISLLQRPFFTSSLVDRAKRWLTRSDDEPFFLFMNLMDAHSPYYPPKKTFRELGFDAPNFIEKRTLNWTLISYFLDRSDLSEEQKQRTLEFYDASVRYQNEQLLGLFKVMRENGIFDDTLIVVCADHGKTLGDFDRNSVPPHYVRDINTNVPLIVKNPTQTEPKSVSHPVNLLSLHQFFLDGGEEELHTYNERDFVLVEDYYPHTGSEKNVAIDCWRALCFGDEKYVENNDGDSFYFQKSGLDETIIEDVSEEKMNSFSQQLTDTVAGLQSEVKGDGEKLEDVDGNVQDQLRDLGYLD